MKIKVKDGKGKRVVTEIKRPDPQAVLVLEEDKEYDVTNEELNLLIECEYVHLRNVTLVGEERQIKAVYPDSITYHEPLKQAESPKVTPKVEPKKG